MTYAQFEDRLGNTGFYSKSLEYLCGGFETSAAYPKNVEVKILTLKA